MYVYVYVCMYMYVCICMYVYVYVYMYIYLDTCIYILYKVLCVGFFGVFVCACICVCVCVCVYILDFMTTNTSPITIAPCTYHVIVCYV